MSKIQNKRTVLVLGRTGVGKTQFINYLGAYWKYTEFSKSLQPLKALRNRRYTPSTEVTRKEITAFGVAFRFVDVPGSHKPTDVTLEDVDTILVVLDEEFSKGYLKYLTARIFSNDNSSYNTVFVIIRSKPNQLDYLQSVAALNEFFKSELKVLKYKTIHLIERNKFFMDFQRFHDVQCALGQSEYHSVRIFKTLKNSMNQQRFSVNENRLKYVAGNLFTVLLEILYCIEDNLKEAELWGETANVKCVLTDSTNICCKNCSDDNVTYCHTPCFCFGNGVKTCTMFDEATQNCKNCGCDAAQHVINRINVSSITIPSELLFKKYEIESSTWSLVLGRQICQDDVYKNVQAKIGEFKRNSYDPGIKDVAMMINDFIQDKHKSVVFRANYVAKYLQPECRLVDL